MTTGHLDLNTASLAIRGRLLEQAGPTRLLNAILRARFDEQN
jgi:hypothetical protein